MWLLHTETITLKEFMANPPPYVILSHTWGADEVSFQNMHEPSARKQAGFEKISRCCAQARISGFDWVWVDTCCINKQSSAELTEAINSMYNWYWQAEICYAYLFDVPAEQDCVVPASEFIKSKWFSRGWTLQELLAPAVVEFYDREWTFRGTKCSLADCIEKATRIARKHLSDRHSIKDANSGTRLSWASRRATTRPEDVAYSLLGLLGVNMPLLYGEGSRAFYRLQLEIIKQSSDHTIFAWDPQPGDVFEQMGILAPSPRQFEDAARIKRTNLPRLAPLESVYNTYDITNRGLRISLPRLDASATRYIGLLSCRLGPGQYLGLQLERNPNEPRTYRSERLVRAKGSKLILMNRLDASDNYPYSCFIQAESVLLPPQSNKPAGCVRISVSQVDFQDWTLQYIAKRSSTDSAFRTDAHGQCNAEHSFVIPEDTSLIAFSVRKITFAIAVKHSQQHMSFALVEPAPRDDAASHSAAMEMLHKTAGFGAEQDHKSWRLDSDVVVTVSARKGKCRKTGDINWTATIELLRSERVDYRSAPARNCRCGLSCSQACRALRG